MMTIHSKSAWLFSTVMVASTTVCLADGLADRQSRVHEFRKAIAGADRIVVRARWFPSEGQESENTLLEVKDPQTIKEFSEHLRFDANSDWISCFCAGYLGIDWYQGKQRLVRSFLQHGQALRWEGFQGDARLTDDSSQWLVHWLAAHGVIGPIIEREPAQWKAAVAKESRQRLAELTPPGFLKAVRRGEAEFAQWAKTGSLFNDRSQESEEELKDKYMRAAIPDKKVLYATMFRLLGCLPMRWEVFYWPEQEEAYDFLARAPRAELDRAIQAAARAGDKSERRGGARFVFTPPILTVYQEPETNENDIDKWTTLLADAAYSDPLPVNRQRVVRRLMERPKANRLDILDRATRDQDQEVRRAAIEALRRRGGADAVRILQCIAHGKNLPPAPLTLTKDYADGVDGTDDFPTIVFGTIYADTDQDAAKAALRNMAR